MQAESKWQKVQGSRQPARACEGVAVALVFMALAACSAPPPAGREASPTNGPAENLADVRAIAKEAYIYGYPLVDNYRVLHATTVNRGGSGFKAPFNTIASRDRVATPDDTTVQTPNSDTPYSNLALDLRAEPVVLILPAIDQARYYSVQLIDLYTHNYSYLGTRATGNGGGAFLVAGPGWSGDKPKGITEVIRTETELAQAVYRTQLFNPADIGNVKTIQARYLVQPLSAFLGQPAPAAAAPIAFIDPLTIEQQRSSLDVFRIVNFVLQFCPTHPSETELMARFARIGVGRGQAFDAARLALEVRQAMEAGIKDAWEQFGVLKTRVDAKEVKSGEVFGTREFLKNNYLYRMAGVVLGIYGNSAVEAMYPAYMVDADGAKLDGAAGRYTLRFAPSQLPPVNAFWSLTMYELPSSLLTRNPLDRYLINSPMLPQLTKDQDGGLTLYIQHASPGKAREANWLPAPKGPFWMALRLYLPHAQAIDGTWKEPPLKRMR